MRTLSCYTTECVETGFRELPLYGVLRSSASARGTLEHKEGDVILMLPALPYEGMKLFQEEVSQCSLLTMISDERTKPGKAEHLALRSWASTNPSV